MDDVNASEPIGMTEDERVRYLKWLEGPREKPFTFGYKLGRHSDSWYKVNPETLEVSTGYESHEDDDWSWW